MADDTTQLDGKAPCGPVLSDAERADLSARVARTLERLQLQNRCLALQRDLEQALWERDQARRDVEDARRQLARLSGRAAALGGAVTAMISRVSALVRPASTRLH